MAIEVIVAVMNARKASWKGGELAVLLGMANYAHPNGSNIFPSIDRLARCCRMSVRGVQTCITSLLKEEPAVLKRVHRASGRPGMFDVFQIDMALLGTFEGCKICGGVKCSEAGCLGEAPEGVQNLRGYGCNPQQRGVQNEGGTGAKHSTPYRKTRPRPVNDPSAGAPRAPERRGDPAMWEVIGAKLERGQVMQLEAHGAEPVVVGERLMVHFPKAFSERHVCRLRRQIQGAAGRQTVFTFAGKESQA